MSIILDGKKVSQDIATKLHNEIMNHNYKVSLAIIQVGDLPESTAFINQKKKFGEKIGVEVRHLHFPNTITEHDLMQEIRTLNEDVLISGIIVQLPLPAHIHKENAINSITPTKDVDGLTAVNLRNLMENTKGLVPATARGIVSLLEYYGIEMEGKKVAIVGRSVLVGKSTALLLLNKNATVTVCHSRTANIKHEIISADIVIVATGVPKWMTKDFVHEGQTLIDVGITIISETLATGEVKRSIVGDIDFDNVKDYVYAITPVPGGVGPMTVASLFQNCIDAYVDNK